MPHCGIFCLILHQARPRTAVTAVPFADGKSYSAHTQRYASARKKVCIKPSCGILRRLSAANRRVQQAFRESVRFLPKTLKSRQKVGFFVGKITLLCANCEVSCALPLTTLSVCEHCLTVSKVLGRIASSPVKGGRGTRTKGAPYTLDEGQNCSPRFCNYTCASFAQKILLPAVGQTYALFPPIPLPS